MAASRLVASSFASIIAIVDSYSAISARSARRSSVRPKRSNAVPRSPFIRASMRKAVIIHGPYCFFTRWPCSSRFENSGGARLNLIVIGPFFSSASNCALTLSMNAVSVYSRATSYSSL